ncbi:hypothetical protein ACW7G2_01730 [Luteimonas sp. A277]
MSYGTRLALGVLIAAAVGGNLYAAEAEPLQHGVDMRGEITTSARLNHSDGSRSRLYQIEIGERELVSFDLSGALRAQLSLFDGEELVARAGDGSQPVSLALRAPRSAEYTLAVSGADGDAFGPYTLRSQVLAGWDGQPLRAGSEIMDWVEGSARIPLRVDRQAMYTINLRSDQFDTMLGISGEGLDTSDDDGGEGTHSRLGVMLAPGTYTLTVSGWGDSGKGLYRLAVDSRPTPAGLNQGGTIRPGGAALQGAYQGTPLSYQFALRSRQLVSIDMRSTDIDPLLVLRGAGVEHYDDDGGEGLDARLVRVLEPGEYTIEASAATGGAGLFSLALGAEPVPEGTGGGPLVIGEALERVLLPDATDRYTLTVETEGEYVIDVASDHFDSWVELFDAAGDEVASDDDGGGALNARIRMRLDPGNYVIAASSISGGGRYRISISAL